jgi:hypothetical protein
MGQRWRKHSEPLDILSLKNVQFALNVLHLNLPQFFSVDTAYAQDVLSKSVTVQLVGQELPAELRLILLESAFESIQCSSLKNPLKKGKDKKSNFTHLTFRNL